MKSFIIALVMLLAISCLTFGLSRYAKERADFFLSRIEEIGASTEENLTFQENEYKKLISIWEKHSFAFNITTTHENILQIEEGFAAVIGSCTANDKKTFLIERQKLQVLFKDLKKSMTADKDNII